MTNLELIDKIRIFIKEHSYNRYESFTSNVCMSIVFVGDIEKFLKELEDDATIEELAESILGERQEVFKRSGE